METKANTVYLNGIKINAVATHVQFATFQALFINTKKKENCTIFCGIFTVSSKKNTAILI